MPLFEEVDTQSKRILPCHKHSPVVAITHNGKNLFVNKTKSIVVASGESKCPQFAFFELEPSSHIAAPPPPTPVLTHKPEGTVSVVQESLEVDDICVFSDKDKKWKIGKDLQFSHYLEETKSSRQYRGTVVNLSEKSHKFGVLRSWYESSSADTSSAPRFSLEHCEDRHTFIPVTL